MFEMKNEGDTTSSKKKKVDFLKELDKDSCEKGCEYAILVSMLEGDNELYMILLIWDICTKDVCYTSEVHYSYYYYFAKCSIKSMKYKEELALAKAQNIDVSNFEAALFDFKDKYLRIANNKAEDFSIKRLTKNNPTMSAKFEALKKN